MFPIRKLIVAGMLGIAAAWAEEEKTSERCGTCHEDDLKEWRASPHANAMGSNFQTIWLREGKKWECLACHTTRYDRKAGTYSHEGIGCESCHGPFKEDHPEKQKMTLPVKSEVCQTCHSITYGEWRISAHGQKNIRCFDCHKMHQMHLRKDDPDQMCGSCHTERLQSYSHATHHVKGVKCIACHMPQVMGTHVKIKGTGTRGHNFGVGAETCAGCHREMVHASSDRAALQEEVNRLKLIAPKALENALEDKTREVAQLQDSLQANRRVLLLISIVTFFLGIAVGYALFHRSQRNQEQSK